MILSRLRVLLATFVAVVAIFSSILSEQVSAQLVGYWNFDGHTVDLSGTGNDGELFGALYDDSVPSVIGSGQSLSFNVGSDHVLIPANTTLNSNAFTLSMFINDRGQTSGINRFTSREGDTFETGIDKVFGTNSLSYYPGPGGWRTSGVVPSLNTWQHVAYVSDGTTMTLYLDGAPVGTSGFTGAPAGFMHIGNRHNGVEGFNGLIDDVALFDKPLAGSVISQIANGSLNPLEVIIIPPPPPPVPSLVVTSNLTNWTLSTESADGGLAGTWDSNTAPALPSVSTFTLPVLPTDGATIPHVNNAAVGLSNTDGVVTGIQADNNMRFFRTTFELEPFQSIRAELQAAMDNGGQVYINGQLLATEVSFVVDNWGAPFPGLDIGEDGSVSSVVKFDTAASAFNGFVVGENEIIVALRNPSTEISPAGGFAFRMDLFTQPVPEPTGVVLAAFGLFVVAGMRRRK